jgi:hypothetical protein
LLHSSSWSVPDVPTSCLTFHTHCCLLLLPAAAAAAAAAAAEFELLGQQQEVATKLEAAQQQLNDAQARAEAATAEGNSAREQLSQVSGTCWVDTIYMQHHTLYPAYAACC